MTNRARRNGARNVYQYVGDYTNPILKPEAAEIVRKHGEISLTGADYPTPRNQCWPRGVPGIFPDTEIQMLQQPGKITILAELKRRHIYRVARRMRVVAWVLVQIVEANYREESHG